MQKLFALINQDVKHDRQSLSVLKVGPPRHASVATRTDVSQDVHSDLLKFRARFGSGVVSSSSSCQEQFVQWGGLVGLGVCLCR